MFKFICPSCGKETMDTTEMEVVKNGDLIECDFCYDVFEINIVEPKFDGLNGALRDWTGGEDKQGEPKY